MIDTRSSPVDLCFFLSWLLCRNVEETHVGLRNVRDRIEQMCGGTMVVNSEPGKGTRVTLMIPDSEREGKKEQEQ